MTVRATKRVGVESRTISHLKVDLTPQLRKRLDRLSRESDQTLAEVIRRSLILYDLLRAEVQDGHRLFVRRPEGDGEILLIEFLNGAAPPSPPLPNGVP